MEQNFERPFSRHWLGPSRPAHFDRILSPPFDMLAAVSSAARRLDGTQYFVGGHGCRVGFLGGKWAEKGINRC